MSKSFERIQFITNNSETTDLLITARKACEAGVRWIQYRNKNASPKKMFEEAKQLKSLCREYKTTLIINDQPDLCLEIGADGVHLGKKDASVAEARNLIGSKFIIGASCHDIDDIIRAQYDGANYVGLGPWNFTSTKNDLKPVLGKSGFEKVMNDYAKKNLTIPVYAIGGVTVDDVEFFLSLGIHGIAVSSALINSSDLKKEFENFKQHFRKISDFSRRSDDVTVAIGFSPDHS